MQNLLIFSQFFTIFAQNQRFSRRFWWKFLGISPNSLENTKNLWNFWISDEFRQSASRILMISDGILTEFRWQWFEWYGPAPAESYIPGSDCGTAGLLLSGAGGGRGSASGCPSEWPTPTRSNPRQGCKIRSGRDRIIRIIAIGILSELMKILLASCWNLSEIQKFDEWSKLYT